MPEAKIADRAGEWDFRGCDTRYGTHGIHTYVAAMIPQLARRLIDRYAVSRGPVLDPFCGGGSVLVEAVHSGRPAIGRDVNKLAVLISKAKTTRIDESRARATLDRIISRTDRSTRPPTVNSSLEFWFKPEHLGPLYSLRRSIAAQVDAESPLLPFFLTVFSATVRDVSLTYRNEIRLRRMTPAEIDRFHVDPIERFRERTERAASAAAMLPGLSDADIAAGAAQSLALGDDECSAIVCSPPYGDERNGVSYAQFSRNMLAWLGHSPDEMKKSKALTLGWGNGERVAPRSSTLDAALDAISGFPRSIREAVAFYADYQAALAEMARVARGAVVIVIGQRVLRDTVFDNGAITVELMRNVGVPVREIFYRTLPTKRLPRMRKFGAAINREAILVFQK